MCKLKLSDLNLMLAIKSCFCLGSLLEAIINTPLLYGNGPGKLKEIRRYNLTDVQTKGKEYLQETAVYLKSETHGGEDVAVYASGPMSFLFDGLVIVTESSENRVNSDFDSKKSRLAIKLKFF